MRQWSTLAPGVRTGCRASSRSPSPARAKTVPPGCWNDIGVQLLQTHSGRGGFSVAVGGGMGRTPMVGTVIKHHLPWHQTSPTSKQYCACTTARPARQHLYKARIKILVKAEGRVFIDRGDDEFQRIVAPRRRGRTPLRKPEPVNRASCCSTGVQARRHRGRLCEKLPPEDQASIPRWHRNNVLPHAYPGYAPSCCRSSKPGLCPGDATADQLDAAAELGGPVFSFGERAHHARAKPAAALGAKTVTCPTCGTPPGAGSGKRQHRPADRHHCLPRRRLLRAGQCALHPDRRAIQRAFQDLDDLYDLGEIDLHISGCINSCGHHHSGHIGVLGVDKDGREWYQVSLGGSDGSTLSGPAQPGKMLAHRSVRQKFRTWWRRCLTTTAPAR
jgi:sulfite reductase (NADPH) hemoprotein beta-component